MGAGHTEGMTLLLALAAVALPVLVLPVLYPGADQSGTSRAE